MFNSEKRPFTAANPLLPVASNTAPNGFPPQTSAGKRGHSHNSKNASSTQQQQYPYNLQLASKTHTGSFGLSPMLPATGSKFVTSAAQLEPPGPNPQLVSLFSPGDRKLKVKPPTKNNIKEKEQLYEDAIKLKIQLNSYREENVKLKTKIKILENDMSKQERAMEDFLAKY